MNELNVSTLAMQQQSLIDEIRNPPGKQYCFIPNSHIYAELVYRKISLVLQQSFPLSHKVLGKRWPHLVEQFIADYECYSPYFYEIPKQFCDFVLTDEFYDAFTQAYIFDLIYFEWIQVDLLRRPENIKSKAGLKLEDIKQRVPSINSRTELWQTHWDCHLLASQDFQPQEYDIPFDLLFSINPDNTIDVHEANLDSVELYEFLSENQLFDSSQLAEEFCIDSGTDNEASIKAVVNEIYNMYQKNIITFA